jgi:hypothetical protein
MAPLVGMKRKMVARNVGYKANINNSKSKKELKMNYIPVETSIVEFFDQLVDSGVFAKK